MAIFSAWPVSAWLFWGASVLLALGGLGLAMWSIRPDSHAGTRRCPHCWYHMTGVPGLRCPECGRAARSEAALFRRRRSLRWGLLALIMALAALPLAAWPKVQRDGWWSLTPTPILIQMWPDAIPEWQQPPSLTSTPGAPGRLVRSGNTFSFTLGGPPRGAKSEIVSAFNPLTLSPWERRLLARRCAWALDFTNDYFDREIALDFLQALQGERAVAFAALARLALEQPAAGRPAEPVISSGSMLKRQSGRARSLIHDLARSGWCDPNFVSRQAGKPALDVAKAAWSAAAGLPLDHPIVGEMAGLTLEDPLLLPDPVVLRLLEDASWRAPVLNAVVHALQEEREAPERCEGILVKGGAETVAMLPRLLGVAQGPAPSGVWRAIFRVVGALGPAARDAASPGLEGLAARSDLARPSLWAAFTLARLNADEARMRRVVDAALAPGQEWQTRWEGLEMVRARPLLDDAVVAGALAAANHESTLMQVMGVEVLAQLCDLDPGLIDQLARLADEGRERARDVAAREILRFKSP